MKLGGVDDGQQGKITHIKPVLIARGPFSDIVDFADAGGLEVIEQLTHFAAEKVANAVLARQSAQLFGM